MKKIIFFILIVILLTAAAWLIFHRSEPKNNYYVVTGNDAAFSLGDPVYVEGKISGFISDVRHITDSSSHTLISFNLNNSIKIPDQSDLGVLLIDTARLYVALNFEKSSSSTFLHSGDTVFLVLDKIERAIHSALAKKKDEKVINTKQADIPSAIQNSMPDLIFKIQVLSSTTEVSADAPEFHGIKKITQNKQDGIFKYYGGEANNLPDARKIQKKIRAAGNTDAFIVPFYKGARISMNEALSLEK